VTRFSCAFSWLDKDEEELLRLFASRRAVMTSTTPPRFLYILVCSHHFKWNNWLLWWLKHDWYVMNSHHRKPLQWRRADGFFTTSIFLFFVSFILPRVHD
jgi:hypothetical protein